MEYLSWNGHSKSHLRSFLLISCSFLVRLDIYFGLLSLDTSLEMQLPFHAYWTGDLRWLFSHENTLNRSQLDDLSPQIMLEIVVMVFDFIFPKSFRAFPPVFPGYTWLYLRVLYPWVYSCSFGRFSPDHLITDEPTLTNLKHAISSMAFCLFSLRSLMCFFFFSSNPLAFVMMVIFLVQTPRPSLTPEHINNVLLLSCPIFFSFIVLSLISCLLFLVCNYSSSSWSSPCVISPCFRVLHFLWTCLTLSIFFQSCVESVKTHTFHSE